MSWYWWNCLPSLLKLSFHNLSFQQITKEGSWSTFVRLDAAAWKLMFDIIVRWNFLYWFSAFCQCLLFIISYTVMFAIACMYVHYEIKCWLVHSFIQLLHLQGKTRQDINFQRLFSYVEWFSVRDNCCFVNVNWIVDLDCLNLLFICFYTFGVVNFNWI